MNRADNRNPTTPTADADAIHAFLEQVVKTEIHLAAINTLGRFRGKWFGDDIEAAVAWACVSNTAGSNVYWTANVCGSNVGNKPSKDDITSARFAHVDIDPPKSGGPLDRDLAIAQLDALELKPSVTIDSGNGIQALWRLSPHVEDWDPVEDLNQELARRLGGDDCHNIDRLLRLPGTINFPSAAKVRRGCVPVASSIVRFDDRLVYSVEELSAAFPAATACDVVVPKVLVSVDPGRVDLLHSSDLSRGDFLRLRLMIDRPEDHFRNKDRSAWAFGIACQMKADGYEDDEVIGALLNPQNAGCAHIVDQANPQRAAIRAVQSAKRSGFQPGTLKFGRPADTGQVRQVELFGDVHNAHFFAASRRGQLAFVTQAGRWMQWTADRWRYCEKSEEFEHAKEVCVEIYAASTERLRSDPEGGRRAAQQAIRAFDFSRIKAMLELAKSEPGMSVTSGELDADPYLLGVQNGVVDLRTSRLRSNEQGLLITRYCHAAYMPNAACPRWLLFLKEVFDGGQDTIAAFQRLLGYSLTGLTLEEVIAFCVGFGANGKSIANNVPHEILGDYAKVGPASLLTMRRGDDSSPRNDFAGLAGARYVSINELQAGARLDEQAVKILAGREKISARFLYGEHFEFRPSFTPWLRTNHKPIITGEDDGIWRRIVILPFRRKFEPHEQDPNLEEKLLAERDGILAWMVEGARLYLQDGLRLSSQMKAEQASYRTDSDLLGEFLEEKTAKDPNKRVECAVAYSSWKFWCDANGVRAGSSKSFTQRLAERGNTIERSNGKRYYSGLHMCSLNHPSAWRA